MRFDPDGDVPFQLERLLNKGLNLEDNVQGGFFEIETTGLEQELRHGLGYTPIGFLTVAIEGDGRIWASRLSDWNSEKLFVQSNVPNLTVRLFVM